MQKFFENVTLGQLFRYGFAGFALLLCGSFLFPKEVTQLRNVLGDVLVIVLAFVVGSAIYVTYRAIADWPLYWIHFGLHSSIAKRWPSYVCKLRSLSDNVSAADGLHAYRCIRDFTGHDESIKSRFARFELEHAEIHMLYAFAFVLGGASIAAKTAGRLDWGPMFGCLGFGLFVVALGVGRDIWLCRRECAFVLSCIDDGTRTRVLSDAKVLNNT
ncbi:MAG TPA: hypothetical protein VMP01_17435 [Pirellulaceae bacterium]|nr:hypothetical protein [Pirellulaceae bacterium]